MCPVASDRSVHSLYDCLQPYLDIILVWLALIALSINVNKSGVLEFVHVQEIIFDLQFSNESLHNMSSVKDLDDQNLKCNPHLDVLFRKDT